MPRNLSNRSKYKVPSISRTNIHGIPYPYDKFPYVVLGWLAIAVVIIFAFPKLVRRIGENLSRAEGIERPPPAS